MRNFIIFFSVVLIVYGSINYYIFIRGWQALPKESPAKYYYLGLFLFLSLSYLIGRFLENYYLSGFSSFFVWTGSYWLAMMVYFLLAVLLIDFLRLLNHFIGIFPELITQNYNKAKLITFISVLVITGIVILAGRINALNPRDHHLSLNIAKKTGINTLKISMASDIHLGTIIGNSRLDELVDKMNSFSPDLILLPGDLVDEDLKPVIKENIGETLRKLKARYGVYAVTGNHEYIGGAEAAVKYLTDHGIIMLRDKSLLIDNNFYLVGREDRSMSQFTTKRRQSLEDLTKDLDKSLPIIMMDHQPFGLEHAEQNGVDLQLSGHTHHGQLWPFNYITDMVYEMSWGYLKKGSTNYYVSSGFGSWGPPIRLGNKPEIIYLTLHFQ